MKVGLFFGSFNPIHIGHLAVANYMIEYSDLNKIWFVISPQNPLKKKKTLLEDFHRYDMVMRAIGDDPDFNICDIEFRMPVPSYTIDTMIRLKEMHPDYTFVIIMGSDGLSTFHKWKNYDILEKEYERYVYPRPGTNIEKFTNMPNCQFFKAPLMDISSSFIRHSIKQGKNIRYFLPPKVYDYITKMHFYED